MDTTKAVFNVQNYRTFLSTQCDSATRNIARMYPYDLLEEDSSNEKTLRGSSQEIADMMKQDPVSYTHLNHDVSVEPGRLDYARRNYNH